MFQMSNANEFDEYHSARRSLREADLWVSEVQVHGHQVRCRSSPVEWGRSRA